MKRIALVLFVTAAVFLAGGLALANGRRRLQQPIAFNHHKHLKDVGLTCLDCHPQAVRGARATIPNLQVCADCHQEPQTESAAEARLVEHIQQGRPVPWLKVHRVPSHVYFSHRRHTQIAKLGCETCHGQVAERELPFTRPAAPLTMAWCLDCHERSAVSNDCVLCHR